MTHPLQFLLRRVLFVAAVILFNSTPAVGSLVFFLVPTSYLLIFAVHEKVWDDYRITRQHIMNEFFLYAFAIMMLFFTNYNTMGVRHACGIIFMALLLLNIGLNCYFLCTTLMVSTRRVKYWYYSFNKKVREK